jgi:hypothetical protein
MLVVALARDISCSPAGIEELPVSVVDSHCVPSVACGVSWRWPFPLLERREAIAFAMAPDHDALQSGSLGNGFVEAGVAFTYCLAIENCVICCAPLDTTAKETLNILLIVSNYYTGLETKTRMSGDQNTNICYIVMTPGEYRPSFVCGRGERSAQHACQITHRVTPVNY